MAHRTSHFPAQLSGGQQQRVAVARAIAGSPSVLLADEPTGNLDSTNGEAVMDLLKELHRGGATIVMVTHDPRYEEYSDRSIHLFDGQVVEDVSGPRTGSTWPDRPVGGNSIHHHLTRSHLWIPSSRTSATPFAGS
jgi:putative ABC transport system ATP-binding protein